MAESPQTRLQRAYKQLFLTPNGTVPEGAQKIVLANLATFCGAGKSPTQRDAASKVDVEATFQAIGRQEVFLHISRLLNLPIQDVTVFGHGMGDIPNI